MLVLNEKINFENLNFFTSSLSCLLMATFYVLSLYLWSKQNRFNRNDPSVIKRRFLSVFLSSLLSLIFIYFISQSKKETFISFTLLEWIGFRFELYSLFKSIVYTLLLSIILFSGPIAQHFTSQYHYNLMMKLYEQKYQQNHSNLKVNGNRRTLDDLKTFENFLGYLKSSAKSTANEFNLTEIKNTISDLSFLRNYVVSTFTEEFVFRSCMLPLLLPQLGFTKTVLITPLYFGMAHLHHILEGIKMKEDTLSNLVLRHSFQFAYTYIFGVYSSYLFLRTGYFFPSFLNHSFCNLMGFPNVGELVSEFKGNTRRVLCLIYLSGFIAFFGLISSLTNPMLFDNFIFSKFS